MIYFITVVEVMKKMEEYDACVSDILPPFCRIRRSFFCCFGKIINVIKRRIDIAHVCRTYITASPYRHRWGFFIAFFEVLI